ncbi:type II toxin-antitoxin system VapC family toxin [Jiella pelagia]|uniref:Ribonuclease VapC n=1 Tax=Jiella pelagia TaxID=2986949 RepID=A0ABY7C500_9HYPH|nr:type II toxin-antitoxin system VapC family toxin [Jiella pelagia]WAP69910.1 type II toxin-antitoxin system VapC family toxin [Jiella pelagia]
MTPGHFYLDTNVFIDLIERRDGDLKRFIERASDEQVSFFTSELTLAEVLVKPIERGQTELARMFEETVVTSPILQVVPVSRGILRRSAMLRAELNNKLADSIHVATAVEAGCRSFVSDDKRLRLPADIERVTATEFGGIDEA